MSKKRFPFYVNQLYLDLSGVATVEAAIVVSTSKASIMLFNAAYLLTSEPGSLGFFLTQGEDETRTLKPSFVAPSQPLEKSLKEHIQRTAGMTDWESTVAAGASASKEADVVNNKKKKKGRSLSKESSPSDLRRAQSTSESCFHTCFR